MMYSILIVDDEESMREFLSIMLQKEGYSVKTASNANDALAMIEKEIFSLAVTDIKMPGMDGIQLLTEIRKVSPDTEVVMITAFGSTDTAVEAMKKGAIDYVVKPFQIDEMKIIIRNILEKKRLQQENTLLKQELFSLSGLDQIVGDSPTMIEVFKIIRKTSNSKSNVLITGESGTGKELVARAIHRLSRRAENSFVTVNCGALPDNLLESELFGYQRGAFTGAVENKKGLFEIADQGAIFLDEIGELTPAMQVKLLRVLQDQEFRRIGGVEDIHVDVRVIAASNQNFQQIIKEKRFREDLFYRLNVIPIHVPPLRERREDIPLLVGHFLKKYATNGALDITQDCMDLLLRSEWRGNVRELENVIERAVVMSQGNRITVDSLPQNIAEGCESSDNHSLTIPEEGMDLDRVITELEQDLLLKALEKSGWVKKEAARILNMSFRSFRYKLSKYGITREMMQKERKEA
jgi:two-component system response regulator PilR (NtrC family)